MSRLRRGSSDSGSGAPSPAIAGTDDSEFEDLKKLVSRQGTSSFVRYLPFAFIFSTISVLLYLSVSGVDLVAHLPYVIVAYVVGVVGLTHAYQNVSAWVRKQRSLQKLADTGEGLWFSLFYNNAFYIFLLFLGSHLVFSTLSPAISLVLTQLVAVLLPAWMSRLSK
jgi:hypothetical protein